MTVRNCSTCILQWYREILGDKVEQFCPFSLLTGSVWHQYFQWHQDVNLGYNLQNSNTVYAAMLRSKSKIWFLVYDNACATLAYVPVSANWESTSSGRLRLRLAMPISPLAKPRPSTSATTTEAPELMVAEEQLVAAKTEGIKKHSMLTPP